MRESITHADLPPVVLARMDATRAPATLRTVIVGGEASDPAMLRRWAATGVRVVSVYGPTEATVCSSLCAVDEAWDAPLLGDPLPGVEYRVEGDELYIGGIGVALGYAADPALTERRFPTFAGKRWFRTGDRVAQRPDGRLVFVGRVDRQLKLAGKRIEPGEIEARLLEVPGVTEAAVVARPLGVRATRPVLVGFFSGEATADAVKRHLANTLPAWMLPARVLPVTALPRNAHEKVDHAALVAQPLSSLSAPWEPSHRGPTAVVMALAWEELLGEAPRPDDEFFASGGDSLTAIELVALCESRGAPLTVDQLYARHTFSELATARAWTVTEDAARLRADVKTLARELPCPTVRPSPGSVPRQVFVTGATGALGGHVLASLLEESDVGVTCLVRAASEREAYDRFCPRLPRDRVRCVLGDLRRPRLGLDDRAWHTAVHECDAIVHGGATVSLTEPYASLRDANVLGTREVLRLMGEGAPKHLVYVSSLDVFVSAEPRLDAPTENDDPGVAERLHGGYAASKWAAEELVRSVGSALGPILVARCGLLVGDAAPHGARRDQLGLFLRGLAALGCAPREPSLEVDLTPLDVVGRALSRAVLRRCSGIWHLASPEPVALRDLVRATQDEGAALDELGLLRWYQDASARVSTSHEAAFAYLSMSRCLQDAEVRQAAFDLFLATNVRLGGRTTRAELAKLGVVIPAPTREVLRHHARVALSRRDGQETP